MDDGLALDELRPIGGSWGGVLFDDPEIWLPPTFAWAFRFDFADVARAWGIAAPQLAVDWSPAATGATGGPRGWLAMADQRAASDGPYGRIESCIRFVDDHRYKTTTLDVVQQKDRALRVVAEACGDLDALGIEALRVAAWLQFDGIIVNLANPPSNVDEARARLHEFTDTTGTEGFQRPDGYWFAPTDLG